MSGSRSEMNDHAMAIQPTRNPPPHRILSKGGKTVGSDQRDRQRRTGNGVCMAAVVELPDRRSVRKDTESRSGQVRGDDACVANRRCRVVALRPCKVGEGDARGSG